MGFLKTRDASARLTLQADNRLSFLATQPALTGNCCVKTKRIGGDFKKRKLPILAARDGAECHQCGEPQVWGWWRKHGFIAEWDEASGQGSWHYTAVSWCQNLIVDHVVPLWKGGGNNDENLQLLCQPCHLKKNATEARERICLHGAEAVP